MRDTHEAHTVDGFLADERAAVFRQAGPPRREREAGDDGHVVAGRGEVLGERSGVRCEPGRLWRVV